MVRPMSLTMLIAATALVGCTGNGGEDCDTSAAVSVSVTVVDPDGHDVDEVTVTYTREDSDEAEACDEGPDVFLCGYEVSGTLTIRAEAPGFSPFETEVTVDREWGRYLLAIPLAARKQVGKREVSIGLKCGERCLVYADAAQLEPGLRPTEFRVDAYQAVDLGPEYSREAVLLKGE